MGHAEFEAAPLSIVSAKAWCSRWHSHLPPPLGGLFALAVSTGGRVVCVAVVSRPVARMLDNRRTVEVTRLASDGSTRGAASFALRAAAREAVARGYARVVSYTILGEAGACYRAARWRTTHITQPGQWSRGSRPRADAAQPGRKVRWETGPEALPRSMAAWDTYVAAIGQVVIPARPPSPQVEMEVG
jgi:hypothetical protein